MPINQLLIRNFCIIAHIDHGKSTLADRLLEMTHTIDARQMTNQVLDSMDLEKERGITIKLQAARLNYLARDGNVYTLNLIDTPGHVDFSYEVSRSLAACEGALLVVDASQGVEAQTLANIYLAMEHNLSIIPLMNKIDLPGADVPKVKREIENILGPCEPYLISAKTGEGVSEVLEVIVRDIPPPLGSVDAPLQALIFDSKFDVYRGVIVYVRIKAGVIVPGMNILMMGTTRVFEVQEVGVFRPMMTPTSSLSCGEVGYIVANIKNLGDSRVGDTVTEAKRACSEALPGYKEAKSMVFCGFYPINSEDYELLKEAIAKLKLNDAALNYEPETSLALGFGFRCGFLGLLHMEIIQERIRREFNLEIIATIPSVRFRVCLINGNSIDVDNPVHLPDRGLIDFIQEPYVKATIILPNEYIGAMMDLCNDRRGKMLHMEYLAETRVLLHYYLPLVEIITDFFDRLKSVSRGYASFDYELEGYQEANLVKVDILLKNEAVDAFSFIAHQDKAYGRSRDICAKLKELIPRQMFEIPIQAAIGAKVICRETISAIRKNVLAKCYGGDISRKRKLLEKQKEGKKKMKNIGSVDIPQEAFLSILKIDQ